MKNILTILFIFMISHLYSQGLSFGPTISNNVLYPKHPKICAGVGITFSSIYVELNKSLTKDYGEEIYYSDSGEDTTRIDDVNITSLNLGLDVRTYKHNLYIRPKVGCVWGEKIHRLDNERYYLGTSVYKFIYGLDVICYFNHYVGITLGTSRYEYLKFSVCFRIPNKKYSLYRYIYF